MALDYSTTIQRDKSVPHEKGMKTIVYMAPYDWFETIQVFKTNPTDPGDHCLIDQTHVFKQGRRWIEAKTHLDTAQLTSELVGDPGSKGFSHSFEAFIPGDNIELAEIWAFAKDDEWIVLVETQTDKVIQLGRKNQPCEVNPSYTTGQASAGRNGWLAQIQAYSGRMAFYGGDISLTPQA